MARRRTIVIVASAAALITLATLSFLSLREPVYDGRTLSGWVIGDPGDTSSRVAARDAILRIGTNGTPYLLKWISYRSPAWERRLAPLINKFLRINIAEKRLARAEGAAYALQLTYPVPDETLLALYELMNDPDPNVTSRAAKALSGLCWQWTPALLTLMTNESPLARSSRTFAINILSSKKITSDAELTSVVQALVQCLDDEQPRVRAEAAVTLGSFGRRATAAVPNLRRIRDDPYVDVRVAVSSALEAIDQQHQPTW